MRYLAKHDKSALPALSAMWCCHLANGVKPAANVFVTKIRIQSTRPTYTSANNEPRDYTHVLVNKYVEVSCVLTVRRQNS